MMCAHMPEQREREFLSTENPWRTACTGVSASGRLWGTEAGKGCLCSESETEPVRRTRHKDQYRGH